MPDFRHVIVILHASLNVSMPAEVIPQVQAKDSGGASVGGIASQTS